MYDFVLALNVALLAAIVLWYFSKYQNPLFHPIGYYIIFHALVFVIRPIFARFYDFTLLYDVYGFRPTLPEKTTALLVADLAFVVFCGICAWVTAGAPLTMRQPTPQERQSHVRSFLISAALCLPVGLYSLLHSFSMKSSGINTMINDAATGFAVNTTELGYLNDTQLMIGPLTVLFIWLSRFRWWSFIPFAGYVILKSGTGGRWPFVMACFSLGLFYLIDRGDKRVPWKVVASLVPLLLLFQAVGVDRGESIRAVFQQQEVARVEDFNKLKPMESMDWGNMEFLEYLIWTIPTRTGTYNYFLDQLQIFTEPVPRKLWPGKPIGPPIRMYSLFDYGTPYGMTQSVAGAGWAAGGWIGVAIWASVFAWVVGQIYLRFARSQKSVFAVAAFVIFIPTTMTQYRDGSLITLLKQSLFTMLPIVIWIFMAKYFDPVSADDAVSAPTRLAPRVRGNPAEGASTDRPASLVPRERSSPTLQPRQR